MANVNAPRGFRPVKYRSGKAYTGAFSVYFKDATSAALGIGDLVIRGTASSSPEGIAECVRATADGAITGVVVGIEPVRSDLSQLYAKAADVTKIMVADDPDLILEVQEGGTGTALAVTDIGKHIDAIAGANPNTVTGISVLTLDRGAVATGNTFRLEELVQREDNAVGDYAKWLVSINLHTDQNASATNKTEV